VIRALFNKFIDLDLLPPCKPIVGLLRHAERVAIPIGEWGNELGLTSTGEHSCKLFANDLNHRLTQVYSSPLERCTQTAAILAKSAKHSVVTTSQLLGAPGIFICDEGLVENYFLQYSVADIVKHLLSEDRNPPGFCHSTPTTVFKLINFMLSTAGSSGITLFITHDSILSVVLGYFFKEISLDMLWPDYLEGLYMWQSDQRLHLAYRDTRKQLPFPL
jgi:broad specificity phosphatase PhoE